MPGEPRHDPAAGWGVWLHAVVAGGPDPGHLAGLPGVGGEQVRAVEAAGLVAIVSSVSLAEFGEEPLRRNRENLAWLEVVARDHHRVIDAVARLGPVVPTRLATVYRDDARVRGALTLRQADFVATLRRVAGRTEWGVKAYAAAEIPGPERSEGTPGGSDRPGTAYLRKRSAQLSARNGARHAAVASAEEVHSALCLRSDAARRHAPQDRKLSGEAGRMVLNGAYLVPERQATAFTEAVSGLADQHPWVRLRLTGPWPPYSFAVLEHGRPG